MPKRATEDDTTSTSKKRAPPAEFPECLKQLQKKFEALNIFCAFCDAKLAYSLTFQTLQKTIPELLIQDLAAINVIIPDFVKFNTISAETIEIEFGRPVNKQISREKHSQALGNRGDDWYSKKTNMNDPTPKLVKPNAIKKLIEQQNEAFEKAMSKFIKECENRDLDIQRHLFAELEKYMPCPFFDDGEDLFDLETPIDNSNISPNSIRKVIEGLKQLEIYTDQLVTEENKRSFPDKLPIFGNVELSLPVVTALKEKGINQLYIHQTEALKGLFEGKHVIVSTSTASGKSLIYQIPILESLLKDADSKALYIFPTKALAQDQKRSLQDIVHRIPSLQDILISTFDGDTPSDQRHYIRNQATIIFTNPDMLHHSILPNSKSWSHFFTKLKYVVVDELHVYNGLFGTHIAFIMRRFKRLAHHFGNDSVQFISCSATIDQPDKHMKAIFGLQDNVKLINNDGAPHGKKEFILWNPSLINPHDEASERRDAITEGAQILEYLLKNKIRTIAFCKFRKTCELLMKQLRENLKKKHRQGEESERLIKSVMSYRGGYTAHDRRKIESQMFNGELLGIIATNALELGVDIGSLDAVLMIGVPWSISALWQQSGRSGRRNADSLSLIICDRNPMDQYYAKNPEILFNKRPEPLKLEIEESIVCESHIQCAAEEIPIHPTHDQVYFGSKLPEICAEYLAEIDHGYYRPDSKYRPYPSQFVNIRNIDDDTFAVIDVTDSKNVIIEEVQAYRAGFEIYEGAVFIHQGRTFLVEECNIDARYSRVRLARVEWTTRQRDFTDVDAVSTTCSKSVFHSKTFVVYGQVKVKTVVFGYYRIDRRGRIIDSHDVYMDPVIRLSTGMWVDISASALSELDSLGIDPMAAIHAASHALISLIPRFSASASSDLRTECKNPSATRARPNRIALYEAQPCGVARQVYKFFDQLVNAAIEQIKNCPCQDGCPSCVHISQCSEHNQVCSKEGALVVFRIMRDQ